MRLEHYVRIVSIHVLRELFDCTWMNYDMFQDSVITKKNAFTQSSYYYFDSIVYKKE